LPAFIQNAKVNRPKKIASPTKIFQASYIPLFLLALDLFLA
jgi:hypothetical protein